MTRTSIVAAGAVAGLLLLFPAAPAGATITSSFDAGTDGWVVVDYPFRASAVGGRATTSLPFDDLSGNPPGSVRVGDVYAETGIAAPAAYLGDREAAYGGVLSYDIYLRYTDGVAYPAVVLAGAAMSVYYDAPSPALGQWEHRVVPLTEAGWRVGGTGAAVSAQDFRAILTTLAGLYIYTEWHTGADDTNVDNVAMTGASTAVGGTPRMATALSCRPNPFNPRTTLRFELPAAGPARLAIHDARGRLVRTLLNADLPAGSHEAVWDGRDETGRAMASGMYVARLRSGAHSGAVTLTLAR